jgi:hypothetical protein
MKPGKEKNPIPGHIGLYGNPISGRHGRFFNEIEILKKKFARFGQLRNSDIFS